MVPDTRDFLARFRAALPLHWFPNETPVLDSILSGLTSCWIGLFDVLAYVRKQARVRTASDSWLDLIAADFFGPDLRRRTQQSDESFRQLILAELTRERGTRRSLRSMLGDLTGREPFIFEPSHPQDTGGYGGLFGTGGGLAYGTAGGWGSLALPYQVFVTVHQPTGTGIAGVAGWGSTTGAYGEGRIEYASVEMIIGRITQTDITRAITAVLPVNTVCWTRITV